MSAAEEKRELTVGWFLAAAMVMHLLVLRPQPMVSLAAFAALLAGAPLRGRHIHTPRWLGNILLVLGVIAVVLAQVGMNPATLLGEMAVMLGTLLLLQPVTPRRAQRIVFCMLIMLVAAMFKPSSSIGTAFTIFDVAVFYLLLELAYRPPEITVSFLVSMARSFRIIVPVGIVVIGVFWLFPSITPFNQQTITGFSGGNLDPGSIAELSQSQRVALTAHFAENQPVPTASSIYWRGQVMERNDGFRWSVFRNDARREAILKTPRPSDGHGFFHYTEELASTQGGVVPVLDHAVFLEAKREGQEVAVPEQGEGVLTAVGIGALSLDITSSTERLADEPAPEIERGYTAVPEAVRTSAAIAEIVQRVFPADHDTPDKLRALGRYFQKSGFSYSIRPGFALSLERFLTKQRVGFCEHYATASANLLRLAGVPTRVVTGFRGGEWNPWLRTVTVRDKDAHAWVEAWDTASRRWLRFDPTDFVAPDLRFSIQRELDSSKWPWYRRGWSYGRALVTRIVNAADDFWTRVTSSDSWEYVPQALFMSLVAVALIWLFRTLRSRRASSGSYENLSRLLADLERRAARFHRDRLPGETPLAWLSRLEQAATESTEKQILHRLSVAYEAGMYMPATTGTDLVAELRQQISRLTGIWRVHPAGS